LNATYTAPTRIDGTGLPGSSDLRFGSVTKVNLRMFANLDQMKGLVKDAPWLKGVRVSLVANNLLDSRQRVTDGTGSVPISYQPDLIDPTGRFIGIDISKRF
jgi:iron complex outermembrane receptor protein